MTWLTIFPLRFHLAERYPLHDKILHPHLARFDPLTFVPMRENRSINFIQRVENFNLSSIRFFFNLFSFLFRKHFRPSPRWSPDYVRENCDVEKDDDDDESGKRSSPSLNFVRSFVRHRSVIDLAWTPRLGKSRWRMEKSEPPIWLPIRSRAATTPIFRAFAPRSVLPRPLFAFDCELWAIANQDSDYSSKRWMERGNVPLLLLFFARRHGV